MKKIFNLFQGKNLRNIKKEKYFDENIQIPLGYNVDRWELFFKRIKKKKIYPNICVDVGAGRGTGVMYEAFRDSKHYVFEPVEENIKFLKDRLKKFNYELFPFCVSDKVEEVSFFKSEQNYLTSTVIDDYIHKDTIRDKAEKIRTITLNDVLKNKISGENNLMKIDVQGSDLKVLVGASNILKNFEIIIIESSIYNFSMSEKRPTIINVVKFLEKYDFSLIDILSGVNRPYDDSLAQLDLVFAKNKSELFSYHEWM